jgi:hypothetical protein
VRGRVEPRTRVRKLYRVDLWEISIVTFPLLNGARVNAVKEAPPSRLRAGRAGMAGDAAGRDIDELGRRRGGTGAVHPAGLRRARCPARPRRSQARTAKRGGTRRGDAVMSKYQGVYDAHQRALL